MKLAIINLESCGVNYQKDYLIEQLYPHFNFTKNIEEADTIIMLGGCCCTTQQLNQTINFINYILENKKSNATTYLTGCITRNFKDIKSLKEIENNLKENIDFIIEHYEPNKLLRMINSKYFDDISKDEYGICSYNQSQADIFIQNGCKNNCTFCKSNYLNCELKDMSLERIKDMIDFINEEKIKKVQLRGLNLSQYGLDLYKEHKLMEICEYIENKPNIEEVILSNFAFKDAIKHNFKEKLKYLEKTITINTSLESGSNRILELMNKGFTIEELLEFYNKINEVSKKQISLNIISGFPTETIDDCLKTLEILKYIAPNFVNINTYLDSEFIPSHNLEQLSKEQIRNHTKIYSKVLRNNDIKYKINGAN